MKRLGIYPRLNVPTVDIEIKRSELCHHSFSRSKYFHLLIAPIEGFITLSRELQNGITLIPTAQSEYPMWTLLISCLIHSFLEVQKKNRVFKTRESLPFLLSNLKWRAKFKIFRLLIHGTDWLNFIQDQKKRGLSINLDIHHSKVLSSDWIMRQIAR